MSAAEDWLDEATEATAKGNPDGTARIYALLSIAASLVTIASRLDSLTDDGTHELRVSAVVER